MSEVELSKLKTENESLKKQLEQNSTGVQQLIVQAETFQGELADARAIGFQLRLNLVNANKKINELTEANKSLKAELAAKQESKSAEVPPKGK